MQRTLTLTSALGLALLAGAQLPPDREAPLRDHLTEVNAEWHHHINALANADRVVSFTNDTERIAQHLHLVRTILGSTTPEGLSAAQAAHRADLLADLEQYADRGLFPRNYVLPYRNPIFIDPHRTACAVGHLMIASGAAELALRIDAEMETAYVREMKWPEIGDWAGTNGFNSEELAWIQPAYSPNYPWATLGSGTDQEVSELLHLSSGDLLVAGRFTEAGGEEHIRVTRWNGTAYTDMGALPEGNVNCSIEFDGDIYIGGSFNGGTTDLLQWDGAGWSQTAVFASKYAEVTALHVHNGALHAAGARSGFAGVDHMVFRRSGADWLPVGQSLNGPINTLETFGGTLVCGGSFTDNFLTNTNAIQHVARLNDDEWQQIGDGLDGNVYDMLVHNGQLHAAGDLISEAVTSFGLARITTEAPTWEQLMPNLGNYFSSPLDGMTSIQAMVEKDGSIFLGGNLAYGGPIVVGTSGDAVVRFGGTADEFEPYCVFSGPVNDIELTGTRTLVIGGASVPFSNIAALDLTTGIDTRPQIGSFTVVPNPATDLVSVQLPKGLGGATKYRITDATGRIVELAAQRSGDVVRFSTATLAPGNYQIEAQDGERTALGRFVKE
ncbi:MAG: T9SS type A sorting domain-containing protein [Flavobacteriales bacterium]|nr:T9SS type A sorting domain-containing protein [Flavobacteriales bacterium]